MMPQNHVLPALTSRGNGEERIARIKQIQERSDRLRRHGHEPSVSHPPASLEILTDRFGRVIEVCGASAEVLNLSAKGLEGRDLHLFVAADRPELLRRLEAAARGHEVVVEATLRPRDRKPRPAVLRINATDGEGMCAKLRWRIELRT